jgi:transcriptional regulator with XRE-family HTH domain
MTQAELGRTVSGAGPDVSEASCAMFISYYERGERLPRKERVIKIARVLDYPVADFIDAARESKLNSIRAKVESEYVVSEPDAKGEDRAEEAREVGQG